MQNIKEMDVKDPRGNVVISKGLKVRHVSSQYEYTVDSVIQEPSGDITVMLASPEAARFDTKKKSKVLPHQQRQGGVLYETEPVEDLGSMYYEPTDQAQKKDDLLAVPSDEFEKEYEVR